MTKEGILMSRQNWYNSLSNDVNYKSVKKFIIVSSLSLLKVILNVTPKTTLIIRYKIEEHSIF